MLNFTWIATAVMIEVEKAISSVVALRFSNLHHVLVLPSIYFCVAYFLFPLMASILPYLI